MSDAAAGGELRIGLRVAQYGRDWAGLERAALLAERRGFACLWVNDHLRTPGRLHTTPAFDAFTTLAGLARATERVGLGTVVLSASYRPPAVTAKMLGSVSAIAGRRLTVGLGTGSDEAEHAAYGIPFADPAARAVQLKETFAVVRAMFDEPEGATAPGLGPGAINLPAPARPPILIAANKSRLLAFAGREADGIVVAFTDPDGVARRREVALAARQPDRPLRCVLYTYALPMEEPAAAEAWLRAEADALGTSPARLVRWLAENGIVGRTDEIAERLAEHAAAGVDEVALVLPNRVPDEAIDALADAVLPSPAPASSARTAGAETGASLVDLLIESHRRAGRGGDVAAIEGERTLSFDELAARASGAAGTLSRGGVRRGDRVAILLPDGLDWLDATLGALWLGAVAVPLDPQMPPERAADVLGDCDPAAVIRAAPETGALTAADLAGGPGLPPAPVAADDLAYLIYSSGSTGRPKAAMHAHSDPEFSVESYARDVLGLGPGDRCFSVAGLFTSLGFGNGFFRPLGAGAAAVLSPRRPTVRAALETVAAGGVTVLTGVPTFWSQLARFLERHPDPSALAGVRLAVSSGDSLPATVLQRLTEVTGVDLVEGLGCSECSNTFISTRPGEPMPGLIGRPVAGIELRLADEDGEPVARGEAGQLWVKSPSNTTGYWRRRELTRATVIGEWLRLGDVLREVEPGVYRHVGRTDARFKVDALWVNPAEVEAALLDDAGVAEAAVLPVDDEHGLTRVAAVLVAAESGARPPDAELRRRVAAAAGRHAAPARIIWREELPRLASGKLDRRSLAAALA